MTWKSYAVVSGATVLAGWMASTPPSNAPTSAAREPRQAVQPSSAPSDIEQQALRLQARIRSERAFAEPARDPFRFAVSRPSAGSAGDAPRPEPTPATVAPAPAAPRISLSGLAEDQVDGRVQRTAILSSPAGVLLVREGEEILGQYRVVRIESEAVELLSLGDGSTLRLSLRP